MKETLRALRAKGKSIRELSQLCDLSRNTIRRVLKEPDPATQEEVSLPLRYEAILPLIKNLLIACKGNLVRVQEQLAAAHSQSLAYSTLTWLVRKYQLREKKPKRVGFYQFEPGCEMQHDTSPHEVIIGGKRIRAQCAALVLAFSRRLFIQYYPCYTRFETKAFLSEALIFMQGSCQRCVIDNTSVIVATGSGAQAVMSPEMVFFGRLFGFYFMAHAVNHPNRKASVERYFFYAETNFLAGREFKSWADLNQQARDWCSEVANQKYKETLGMTPEAAYIQEKPALQSLPAILPPIYQTMQRQVDTQGFINLDHNRYSVPESHIGRTLEVYKYLDKVEIYYQHRLVATHPRSIGQREQRSTIKGHHPTLWRKAAREACSEAERQLRGLNPLLDEYITAFKPHVRGRGQCEFKQLLYLKRLYPLDAFMKAIEQAHRYGLYNLQRLEKLILNFISGDFFNLK